MISHREGDWANEPEPAGNSARPLWTEARRQEWIEEYRAALQEPPALTLGEYGLIRECSKSLELLFGFRCGDLVWQSVELLFPQLAGVELVREGEINPMLNYIMRCGKLYHSQNRHGERFFSHLSLFWIELDGRKFLRLIVRPAAKL